MTTTTMGIRKAVELLAGLTDEQWEKIERVILGGKEENITQILPYYPKERTFEDVTKLIHMLGVPAHLKGYDYLRAAIIYFIKADNMREISMTKELYPEVAKEFETTPLRAERNIRSALQAIYAKGSREMTAKVFGNMENVPKNNVGIATMAEYLKNNKI